MDQGAGFTPRQKQLLDLVIKEPYFVNTFYLSGGTALSSWYLHHRESLDLDFFSLVPFDYERITRWFRQNKQTIGYADIRLEEDFGFLTIEIVYSKQSTLHIDFHHYSKWKLAPGIRWHGLEIDSLRDITVNKIHTIATLPRTRDYIDFYFIMNKKPLSLDSLMTESKRKFKETMDPLQLAKNFLKSTEITELPKMLAPFDQKEMQSFYEDIARTLKKNIFSAK